MDIGGALLIPTLNYGPESDTDFIARHGLMIHRIAISQIITSLEVYYSEIFSILTNNIRTSQINPRILSNFIKDTKFSNDFTRAIGEQENFNIPISTFVPDFFPLQNKERIKKSFQLFGLNPASYSTEWEHTFGNDVTSTIRLPHEYIHSGINWDHAGILSILMDTRNRIKDAIVLVCSIEKQIQDLESIRDIDALYPRER